MDDPHATLGVPRGTDAAAIKAAFRRRALALHPDRVAASGGDAVAAAAAFARVKAAYDALGGGGKPPSDAAAAAAATARAHAANPYARAWTGRGGRRPPPPPPPPRMRFGSLFRVIAERSTRGDAVAHAGMLSIALVGDAAAAYAGDAAWKSHNEGKLWDDVLAARRERERERARRAGD